jgi:ferrous iron transport protein B
MADEIIVGLAGNPNSGKTTLFNELTGAHHHVGNYPGVTVEKKEGLCRYVRHRHHPQGHPHHTPQASGPHGEEALTDRREMRLVDLPGTYSLTAYSMEELVARNFVVQERPDVVIDVVDASNLERNLYLASQLIELEQPTVIALNMMDVVENQGLSIDHELLGQLMGVPMVPISAARSEGLHELLCTTAAVGAETVRPAVTLNFGSELEPHIQQVTALLATRDDLGPMSPRWAAIKLLENDSQVREIVQSFGEESAEILAAVDAARGHIEQVVGDDAEIAIADRRYGFIAGAVRQSVRHDQLHRVDWSEAVDRVVVSRFLGLPILVLFMWAMFEMVFRLGAAPMGWIEAGFTALASYLSFALPPGDLQSLIVDGIIGGVGGVLVFVPNIALLFLAISILEDSGYMARAAFVVDRIMHHVGLHGKSFIPMLVGFGCTVPAIMATRILDEQRDRTVTMLIAPFMSCGARLPVYILLAGAFFAPAVAGKVIFSIYALGVVIAMAMALVLRRLWLKGPNTPFVMELPPYRLPTAKGVAIHVWERAWQYVKKAGTVILGFAVVMWALMSYPKPPEALTAGMSEPAAAQVGLEYSIAGRVGKTIEPVLRPLGLDWKAGVALVAGFGAKEVVVSTLGTAYSLGAEEETGSRALQAALRAEPGFTPLVAYTLMVFVLLYIPCLATVAVIAREFSWRWAGFVVVYTTTVAWIVAFVIYNVGRLLGLG